MFSLLMVLVCKEKILSDFWWFEKMFEGDFADACGDKLPFMSMGGWATVPRVHRLGERGPPLECSCFYSTRSMQAAELDWN